MGESYDERRYWTANNGYTRATSTFLGHNHRNQRPLTIKMQLRQCGGRRPAAVPIPPRLQRPGHRSGSRTADLAACMWGRWCQCWTSVNEGGYLGFFGRVRFENKRLMIMKIKVIERILLMSKFGRTDVVYYGEKVAGDQQWIHTSSLSLPPSQPSKSATIHLQYLAP
jgi:hypothetical protein